MKKDKQEAPAHDRGMNASSLRNLLTLLLLIIIASGITVYYLAFADLRTYSIEVGHRVIDANASAEQVKNLQALKNQLSQEQGLIAKANEIFATDSTYQSAAIRDVQHYADLADISITTTFDSDLPLENSRSFSVIVNSAVPYNDFIAFLRGVESNIPKLQVTHLSIGRAEAGGELVTVERLIISIFVR